MHAQAALAAAALALASTSAAHAQFANMDINGMNARMNAQMNAQMNQRQNSIVQSNMNDPRVIAAYRQNPRGMSFQQFAYYYAATGGFSPQGMQSYYGTSNAIVNQQKNAWAGYQGAVQNYNNAYQGWTGGYSGNQQEAGRGLMGQQTYVNPMNGHNVQLQYTQPGQTWTQGGYTYRMAPDGQYYATTGNGYWTQVNPAAQSPR